MQLCQLFEITGTTIVHRKGLNLSLCIPQLYLSSPTLSASTHSITWLYYEIQ